jgi:hypothetical protein
MGAIASLALAFAFLPTIFSAGLAVSVLGILLVHGSYLRPVTSRSGAWRWLPWVVWFFALMACPVAIAVIGTVYKRTGPPIWSGPRPWAEPVVEGLAFSQYVVSVIASVAVVALTRSAYCWLAWVAVLAIGAVTFLLSLGAAMSTTGVYL